MCNERAARGAGLKYAARQGEAFVSERSGRDIPPPAEVILRAQERRAATRREPRTNAFRLLNGPADGAPPGLTLDRYERWLVLAARSSVPMDVVHLWGDAAAAALDPDGVVMKTLAEDPRQSRSEVLGDRLPPLVMVREGDATFECRLDDGVQTGLFLDHRDTRWRLREHASGVEVLNLFAYTCTFSVHAALGGASRVTSVDVSQRALAWGRRNMAHSGLDPNQHRWFGDDALAHVRRPRRCYGVVVLDPPVFGHGRRPFSLSRDMDELFRGALEQLDDDGVLAVSSHHREIGADLLEARLMTAGNAVGAELEVLDRMGLPPWDHPTVPSGDDDRGSYLDTLLVRLHR